MSMLAEGPMQERRECRHGLFSSHDLIWVFVDCCTAHMRLLVHEQTCYVAVTELFSSRVSDGEALRLR